MADATLALSPRLIQTALRDAAPAPAATAPLASAIPLGPATAAANIKVTGAAPAKQGLPLSALVVSSAIAAITGSPPPSLPP